MNKTIALAAAFALLASPAFAHAHLLSETPAANATVAGPASLVLAFSEGVTLKFTGIMIVGPNGAVAITSSALDPEDDKVLDVTLASPLAAGKYTVTWHALSTDGHKTDGTYSFTVK